jgi:tetratricopeptide (TPR) repeat protein
MSSIREQQLKRAQSLQQSGRLAEALLLYRELVENDPFDALAIHYLGMAEQQSGVGALSHERIDRSIVLLPGETAFYANRAAISLDRGDLSLAQADCSRAICLQSELTAPRLTMGWALLRAGDRDAAVTAFGRLLVVNPTDASFWMSMFRARVASGDGAAALAAACRTCRIDPNHEEALFECGSWSYTLGDRVGAIDLFLRLVALQPAHREGCYRLGAVWRMLSGLEQAAIWLHRAVVIDQYSSAANYEIGVTFDQQGDWQSSITWFQRACILNPSYADGELSLSTTLLRAGCFAEGWHHYRARWRSESLARKQVLTPDIGSSRPDYNGRRRGRRVLVWGEQGVGDDIMFGGLLSEFQDHCDEILLQVDRRLVGFFERALPEVRVFERGTPIPEECYDEHIPLGDLGKWLRPSRESFEGKGGRYLQAQEGLSRRLREELGVGTAEKLVGLSWRSANPLSGISRSIPLRLLVPYLSSAKNRFLNLQYGDMRAEIEGLKRDSGVEVLSHPSIDNMEDLEGLAGLVEACDLVISIGNATAHLGGALGKRTWVLLPYLAGWRWLHEGDRCPWYESVDLYRQVERDRWDSVLEQMGRDADSLWRLTSA